MKRNKNKLVKKKTSNLFIAIISIVTSASTLICCVLPGIFIFLGFGSVLASLISTAPWLIDISQHKVLLFVISGIILGLAIGIFRHSSKYPCPIDPVKALACKRLRLLTRYFLFTSLLLYLIGLIFNVIVIPIFI